MQSEFSLIGRDVSDDSAQNHRFRACLSGVFGHREHFLHFGQCRIRRLSSQGIYARHRRQQDKREPWRREAKHKQIAGGRGLNRP